MSKVIYRERNNTDSVKWDNLNPMFGRDDLLPLWVADMDFEVDESIKIALNEYVNYGVYGYYKTRDSYYDAFIEWEEKYHDYKVKREWICFAPGIVPAISWLVNSLTKENDPIMIMQPVYYPFTDVINNSNRKLVKNHLINTNGYYTIDYEDFESKIIAEDVKMFILCSPHNPVGRVWKAEELVKILDICKKHNVIVLADEIHQDIVMSGYKKLTAASMGDYGDILITLTANTKTFNLASVQNSFVVIENEELRQKYNKYKEMIRVNSGNAFGYIAVETAYRQARGWLEEVLEIIETNYIYLRDRLARELPQAVVSPLEGTYLLWVDLGNCKVDDDITVEEIVKNRCKLGFDFGHWFGGEKYKDFVRINLATEKEIIEEVADRLIREFK